jgi:hypothetical protein
MGDLMTLELPMGQEDPLQSFPGGQQPNYPAQMQPLAADPQESPEVQQVGIMSLKGLAELSRKEPEQAAFALDKIAPGMTVRELNDPATMQAAAMRILQPRMYDLDKRLAAAQANQQDISRDLEALANRPSFSRGNALGAALAGLAVGFATKGKPGGGLGYGLMAAGGVANAMQKQSNLDRQLEREVLSRKATVAADEIKRLSGERADLQDRAEDFSLDALSDQFSSNLQSSRMREKAATDFGYATRLEGEKQANRFEIERFKAQHKGASGVSDAGAQIALEAASTGDYDGGFKRLAAAEDVQDKGAVLRLMNETRRAAIGGDAELRKAEKESFRREVLEGSKKIPGFKVQPGLWPSSDAVTKTQEIAAAANNLAANVKIQLGLLKSMPKVADKVWMAGNDARRISDIARMNYSLIKKLQSMDSRLARDAAMAEDLAFDPMSLYERANEWVPFTAERETRLSNILEDLLRQADETTRTLGFLRERPWGTEGVKSFSKEQWPAAQKWSLEQGIGTMFDFNGQLYQIDTDRVPRPLGQITPQEDLDARSE